ncbi:transporter [Rhodanobacter sp. C03]|uniref:transporter n=1 Tax=Rhodanobacter sp. C03 TaxID=1945858 RepID=UPI0020C41D72|nr:transporter [Rhodanobacter sp. C03]
MCLAAFGTLMLGVGLPALADNPGYDRPGYGFTPVVLGAGDITVEQGLPDWSRDRQAGITSSQYSADSLLRIGIGGPLELQLSSSPWNSLRQSGAGSDYSSQGHGDTILGLKLALPSSNQAFSWGLLGSVEFTDGAKAFRSAQRQYLLGTQFNLQTNERNSLGLYLQDVRSGGADSSTVAVSDNYALNKTLTLYAEAAWLHAPDQGGGTVAGGGLAWMITPRVQFDAGFDRRLGGAAPEWQTNLGVSIYFGH